MEYINMNRDDICKMSDKKVRNSWDVHWSKYAKPSPLRIQQSTSGATIPTTTTKGHTVQNMAALAAVYQQFYGHHL
jgi:hypothetical protein